MVSKNRNLPPGYIDIQSSVNMKGKPFCMVTLFATADETAPLCQGQLAPEEVRELAYEWLHAAEAAEQDAMVFRLVTDRLKLGVKAAGAVVNDLRELRGELPKDSPVGWQPKRKEE